MTGPNSASVVPVMLALNLEWLRKTSIGIETSTGICYGSGFGFDHDYMFMALAPKVVWFLNWFRSCNCWNGDMTAPDLFYYEFQMKGLESTSPR